MKKLFSVIAIMLFISTNSFSINLQPSGYSCSDLALDYLDWYESKYGCVSAEQASEIYSVQEALCLNHDAIFAIN
ncbi:MAG: hypothetical protein R2812_01305 [Gelidibacter sp.]